MIKELFFSISFIVSFGNKTFSNATIVYDAITNHSSAVSPFRRIGGLSRNKVLDCDDGYVYFYTETYKAPFTSRSDLYIEHTVTEFTPGHVTRNNGDDSYKDYNLSNGYVHLKLERYSEDGKEGGEIAPKDYWPKSTSFTTTISSSFGGSTNLDFSSETGVEIGNGASISRKEGNGAGITLSFDKTVSTVMEDPTLSSQFSSNDKNEAQWSISSQNKSIAGSVTYCLDTYYLFEIASEVKNANRDAFILTYEFMYQGTYKVLWWWQDGWTFNASVRISCFL